MTAQNPAALLVTLRVVHRFALPLCAGRRIVFGGDGLADYASTGVGDEYVRLLFPADGEERPVLPGIAGKHLDYSTVDLDKYLGAFNTVALVYRDGFLSDDHLCGSFAFYVEEANQNSEIKKYLEEYPKYFGGFRDLLIVIKKSKSSLCQPYQGQP